MTVIEVLGVRHHGPGSARSVAAALTELEPDLVVIEGPPEFDGLLGLARHADLVPPVAGLAYAVDTPRRAAFYPLAVFSPEWVAMRWAVGRGVDVRFADLPAIHALAEPPEAAPAVEDEADNAPPVRSDPIGMLANAAGYDDPERWWEDAVEHRDTSSLERFAMIREAMAEVRAADGWGDRDEENQRREAAMRRVLRASMKEGKERVAVVCGAYHAPALHADSFPPAAQDNRLLAKLPRTKVAVTWAPWTADRLAVASGYGAGVTSPGWYQHLFVTWQQREAAGETWPGVDAPGGDLVVSGWLTRVARALRDEGIAAAPATVVEAARLADALAAVRGRPSVGLTELNDATQSVLCEGSELPLQLVHRRLVVGEQLGTVPTETPMVPLARDLERLQRSLRLKPSPSESTIILDLRKETQRQRSLLLHRLRLLGIPWASPADAGRTTGTFKEGWTLLWDPAFAVALVEAGLYGTTVHGAATALVAERAGEATDLAALGDLVEQCFLAELPDALDTVIAALAAQTAQQHDVIALLETIEPLARTRRYGDVREADTSAVAEVLDTVVVRASVDLRPGCASLDDDTATRMRHAIDTAQRGISLVESEPAVWREALLLVAADDVVHGLVSGRVNRILLDLGALSSEEVARRLSRHLSVGSAPAAGAAWLDGFLDGDAILLLHDHELLHIVDDWVSTIDETTFEDLLPLLRRTFSRFSPPERRQLGGRLRRRDQDRTLGDGAMDTEVDWERALTAVRRMAQMLGLPPATEGP